MAGPDRTARRLPGRVSQDTVVTSAPLTVDAVSEAIHALEGSATVAEATSQLSAHLAVVQKTVDAAAADAETRRAAEAIRSSAARLQRMVRRLERVEAGSRRTARYDAATLRRSLALQLRAHADLEQNVLSQVHEYLTAAPTVAPASPPRHGLATAATLTRSRAPRWRHPLRTLRTVTARATGRA